MEEKNKKRQRPSLTAYRELEKSLAEATETVIRMTGEMEELQDRYGDAIQEIVRLRSRGLVDRILNR